MQHWCGPFQGFPPVTIRFSLGMHRNRNCHCEPVVLRAANQNLNDCQWQSYLNVAQTGVALSKDSLRSQSPGTSENRFRTCRGRCPHRPETKTYAYIPAVPSGGNVLVPARTLIRSRLRGRCRQSRPPKNPPAALTNCVRIFRIAIGESIEKNLEGARPVTSVTGAQ